MARRPRLVLPGVPVDLVQRGVDRQACFFDDSDRRAYLGDLAEIAADVGCAIHAYVPMTNHAHLLLTPASATAPSRLMNRLGRRYVPRINDLHRRTGTLWEGRFRSCLAGDDGYVLACYRYIELNPVRAKIVEEAADDVWSSHRENSRGDPGGVLTPHQAYRALAQDPDSRAAAYRALFAEALTVQTTARIRSATAANTVLGSARFAAQIAAMLGRRVVPLPRGRPKTRREAT